METRKNKDWASQVLKDLIDLGIEYSIKEIGSFKEEIWKSMVKTKTTESALRYLNLNIGSKSRKYEQLKMSNYSISQNEDMQIETAKFIAKAQSHMIETIKTNFPEYYKPNFICNICLISESNQPHLLHCKKLLGSNQLVTYIPNYEDIFDDDNPEEQYFIANILMANLKKKKELLEDK